MPSERDLRRRVRSIRNIRQLTKAMQLVAASKMRRAQDSVLASRPFEERLRTVLNELAPYADPEVSPLIRRRPVKRIAVVLITTDRGLVGPMNVNLLRTALRFARERPDAAYVAVGRKGMGSLRRLRSSLIAEFPRIPDRPTTIDTNPIARAVVDEFVAGNVDEVHLAFTRFVNTLRQEPTIRRLLPVAPPEGQEVLRFRTGPDMGVVSIQSDGVILTTANLYSAIPGTRDVEVTGLSSRGQRFELRASGTKDASSSGYAVDLTPDVVSQTNIQYIFEPDPATVLNKILPRLIEVSVYQAVLESKASQFSAQMVAMRSATDAATDLIDELTLAANKARQARITKEMLEIASGADALAKG